MSKVYRKLKSTTQEIGEGIVRSSAKRSPQGRKEEECRIWMQWRGNGDGEKGDGGERYEEGGKKGGLAREI